MTFVEERRSGKLGLVMINVKEIISKSLLNITFPGTSVRSFKG